MDYQAKQIRNFSIIAHIDHGKSTLADRLIEHTGTVEKRSMKAQYLDNMDLERERGITIKLNAITMTYKARDGQEYLFNLIDTPGHVDFTYEVSRSLAACEGALLLVDATQGVEAQTLANAYLAVDNNLTIIPVINKIDLPSADLAFARREITDKLGLDGEKAIAISAKTGENIPAILEAIIKEIPAPEGKVDQPLRALIFDSYYDSYRGVIVMIRIKEGQIKVGDTIRLMSSKKEYFVTEVGIRTPEEIPTGHLQAGEVGYLAAQIKDIKDVHTGETITNAKAPALAPLPGYREINSMVFCGLYPVDSKSYEDLREALEKLTLSDASLHFEPEFSQALGFGFRCGFLGLLHMDVIQERLEREYGIDLILTAPSVSYHLIMEDGETLEIDNPAKLEEGMVYRHIEEPYVEASIMVPSDYLGAVMQLCEDRRGIYLSLDYLDETRMNLKYELPLAEVIYNFFDKLKSYTKGYASFDYVLSGYRQGKLVKMDILLNGVVVDALSSIVHQPSAYHRGVALVRKLKEIIPAQLFEVPIQVAIGRKVIARADVKALRKDVLSKCYGGDISRKRKLLEKQKAGKKRMKAVGKVEIPQEAFMAVLAIGDDDE
ncbi:MAG: translation elongation factor 4 [Bacilli bacterium]